MQFYEAPTPNDEEKPSEPMPAETEAQVPKDRAAAKKAISGGFCLTVFQTLVCVLILLAAFFLRQNPQKQWAGNQRMFHLRQVLGSQFHIFGLPFYVMAFPPLFF